MSEKSLKFGTSGIRGIMGPGRNQLNIDTIKRATQGLADYLNEKSERPSVIISFDSRNNSREFAECTASVLAANGIDTDIFREITPVPVLSFAIRRLGCTAGVMITASHNSREYNGYKVYGASGGQILDKEAAEVMTKIEAVTPERIKHVSFAEALAGSCCYAPDELYEEYLAAVRSAVPFPGGDRLSVIYTPLNGSGRKPVHDLLAEEGFEVFTVPQQAEPDGNFTTCPYPNPEKEDVYRLALEYAKERGADIITATDPDCDRVGAMAFDGDEYVLLSGNDLGALLLEYICSTSDDVKGRTVVSTIVSTPIIDRIAEHYGAEVIRTLVGFKYIGRKMDELQEKFLFGFEESNGFLTGTYARDKDGAAGVKLICRMAAFYREKGLTLMDALEQIYEKYGAVMTHTVNYNIGSSEEREAVMREVRNRQKLCRVFGHVAGYMDYMTPDTGLPKSDIVSFQLEDGSGMIIRPSGTEPKIKLYISACSSSAEAGRQKTAELAERFSRMLKREE